MRRVLVAAASLATLCALTVPARASYDSDVTQRAGSTCSGNSAFASADADAVRQVGAIPDRWTLQSDAAGRATLWINAVTCPLTVGGTTRWSTYLAVAVVLDSAALPAPERARSTSDIAGVPLDAYLVEWWSTDEAFVHWLQAGTRLASAARHVPSMSYELGSGLEAYHPFRFEASPGHWEMTFSATVTDGVIPIHPIVANYWRETPGGSVMVEISNSQPAWFGQFGSWSISVAPGSSIARMIGSTSQTRTCDAPRMLSPLESLVAGQAQIGCLANDHFATFRIRKSIA